jgi:CcmD family protein
MKHTVLLLVLIALLPGAGLAARQPEARPGAPRDPTAPTTAQPLRQSDAPEAAVPQDFVPVNTLQQPEQLPAAPLLIGAYAFVWVALMVYVWALWRRMAKLERELADLQRRLQAR